MTRVFSHRFSSLPLLFPFSPTHPPTGWHRQQRHRRPCVNHRRPISHCDWRQYQHHFGAWYVTRLFFFFLSFLLLFVPPHSPPLPLFSPHPPHTHPPTGAITSSGSVRIRTSNAGFTGVSGAVTIETGTCVLWVILLVFDCWLVCFGVCALFV